MLHTALSVPDEIKPKIIDIYEQMLIEYDNYDSVAEFALQNLLEQLILIMYRYGTVAETSEIHISTADTEIMDILSYIDTNFMNNPSVSELAKGRIIRISFYEAFPRRNRLFIQNLRQQIQKQNCTDNAHRIAKSIQEISNELGFLQFQLFLHSF